VSEESVPVNDDKNLSECLHRRIRSTSTVSFTDMKKNTKILLVMVPVPFGNL
jgi:hypothetical protein